MRGRKIVHTEGDVDRIVGGYDSPPPSTPEPRREERDMNAHGAAALVFYITGSIFFLLQTLVGTPILK